MTLKGAAQFALAGMIFLTILLLLEFMRDLSSVLRGLVPALRLLTSLVDLFAGLSVTVFFYVFQRTQ
jgi:hypothetical protein